MVDDEHVRGNLVPGPVLVLLLLPFLTLALLIPAPLELTQVGYLDRSPVDKVVRHLLVHDDLLAFHQT